jgi:hypothetical protein
MTEPFHPGDSFSLSRCMCGDHIQLLGNDSVDCRADVGISLDAAAALEQARPTYGDGWRLRFFVGAETQINRWEVGRCAHPYSTGFLGTMTWLVREYSSR